MTQFQTQKTILLEEKTIKYLTIRGYDSSNFPPLSLAPINSDQVDNQTILNSIVGTLVKYGVTGKIEPYLASSWNISDDQKKWIFNIKNGYTCESGEKITSEFFKNSLLKNFRLSIDKADKTDFNLLKGWNKFIHSTDSELEGLYSNNQELIFEFNSAPNGFLNFLRMPYFGIWCPNNFNKNEFKNEGFSSSGPYKIERYISKSRILLSMRKDQPSYNLNSPQLIEIGYGTIDELNDHTTPTIGKIIVESDSKELQDYSIIDAPPLIFQGLVLHPNSIFFSDPHNRQIFSKRLIMFQEQHPTINFSQGFYIGSKIDKTISKNWNYKFKIKPKKIKIALQYLPSTSENKSFLENLFSYILEGIDFEIEYPDLSNPNWIKSILNNAEYDIRTASVYAGAHHVPSVIRMMFCSNLGISFPDPSKRICELTDEYITKNRDVDNEFEIQFNRVIFEDSVVFPLFHAKDRWYVSNKIDIKSMPTSIIHPLFEKIRIEKWITYFHFKK